MMHMASFLSDPSVVTAAHAAFAAATGTSLTGGTVPNLQVLTDLEVPDVEIDLYAPQGFVAKVNPSWVLGLDPQNLTDAFTGVVSSQLV